MASLFSTFIDITKYLKSPIYKPFEDVSVYEKLKTVGYTLILCFGFVFIAAIPIGILESYKIINLEDHATSDLFNKYSPIVVAFMAVILAPVSEECIFRAPLYLFRKNTKGFKYVFYIIAFSFGFIHIINFEISKTILILSPLLVAPQIIAGLLLGYIRVRLGLLYSILLHALFNGLAIIPSLLFT